MDSFNSMVRWIDMNLDVNAEWLDNDEDRENFLVELIDKCLRRDTIEAQTGFLLAEHYDVPLAPALARYL